MLSEEADKLNFDLYCFFYLVTNIQSRLKAGFETIFLSQRQTK